MSDDVNEPRGASSLKIAWKDLRAEAHGPIGIGAVMVMILILGLLYAAVRMGQHYI